MAPPTHLAAASAAAATADSGSFIPTANALLLAFCGATHASGTPTKPTISDTGSLTWTEIGDVDSGTVRETLYQARAEASSPPSRIATVASTSASSVVLRIVEAVGRQVRLISSAPNLGTDTDGAGDPRAALDALGNDGNDVVGGAMFLGVGGVTPGVGFTELGETAAGSVSLMQTQYLTVGAGAGLPLDAYTTNLVGAYSSRKLLSAYGGSGLRAHRDVDDVEQDIGFIDTDLDVDALTAFGGAERLRIATYYDQSGNSRALAQTAEAENDVGTRRWSKSNSQWTCKRAQFGRSC